MPLPYSGAALFAGAADEFVRMAPASSLTTHLAQEFNRRWGTATESEINSWRHSLTALARVVEGAGLPQAGVGVELKLPLTDRRIDASFLGRDHRGQPHVVLVELKQWERVDPSSYPGNVVVAGREVLHPSVQASLYATYLRESHSAFTEDQYLLSACAFLHNMGLDRSPMLRGSKFDSHIRDAPVFLHGEEAELATLLYTALQKGEGLPLLPSLISGRYSPSKELISGIRVSLEGSTVWTLLDEQRIAFNVVSGLVEKAAKGDEKAVVLVVGGPGTGKSVIAVHLLVSLMGKHRACHATGSKAFTTNLRAICPPGALAVFRYFNSFRHKETRENELDVLICDEAHRIRETSNERFTKKALRSEISQVRELIRAARVSVFLLDERQNVRPGEIGNVGAVEEGARQEGVAVHRVDLAAQFRCSGCSEYITWVDAFLSDFPRKPGGWLAAGDYDLRFYESPESLEEALSEQERASGSSRRLVAGFCWPWSDPEEGGPSVNDVKIGSWERPWNEKPPEQRNPPGSAPTADRHPYYLWATQEKGVHEIGCIYSAQGFEFDYCGVILGDDLVWRGGLGWIARKEASRDPAIRRRRLSPAALKALLQHSYRVLLTRGVRGTFVYSTDPETQRLLRSLLTKD